MNEKTKARRIMSGLMFLLMRFGDKVTTHAEHDVFYAGAPGDDDENATAAMEADGWHREEDSWAIYT